MAAVREERVSVSEPPKARAKVELAGRCSLRGGSGIPGGDRDGLTGSCLDGGLCAMSRDTPARP